MTAAMTDDDTPATMLIASIQRDLNCLSDDNRSTRKRALEKLIKTTISKREEIGDEVLLAVIPSLLKPVLKVFGDPVEKCRELAIKLVFNLVPVKPQAGAFLPYVIPTVTARLGTKDMIEVSEEVRLQLIEGTLSLIVSYGESLGLYIDDMVTILSRTIIDPFPDIKRTSCDCIISLCSECPARFHPATPMLVAPLLISVTHQHSKVRVKCLNALGALVEVGATDKFDDILPMLGKVHFDHAGIVRMALVRVVGKWLLRLTDRYSFAPRLFPLLLAGFSDEAIDVANEAKSFIGMIGEQYEKENEQELKDHLDYLPDTVYYADPTVPLEGDEPRPRLGARAQIQKNLTKIVQPVLNELTDWTIGTRTRAAQLLGVVILHSEGMITHHLDPLLQALYHGAQDTELGVAVEVVRCAEMLGRFVDPEAIFRLLLPQLNGKITMSSQHRVAVLVILSAVLRGASAARPAYLRARLGPIVTALQDPEISQSDHSALIEELSTTTTVLLEAAGSEGCVKHSFGIFSLLMRLIGVVKSPSVNAAAEQSLRRMAELQNLPGGPADLIQVHFLATLTALETTYLNWDRYSSDRFLLDTLLSRGGDAVIFHMSRVMPILEVNLHPEKDAELRLGLFATLTRLLSGGNITCSADFARDFSIPVVTNLIAPNLVWKAGRTASAVRTAAVSCFLALIRGVEGTENSGNSASSLIGVSQLGLLMDKLLPLMLSILDDDSISTRLITAHVVKNLLQRYVDENGETLLSPEQLHSIYPVLLKRLDDNADEVRIEICRAFLSWFQVLPISSSRYDRDFYGVHISALCKGLLVHLDDVDDAVQKTVAAALGGAALTCPALLLEQIAAVRDKHRSPSYCDDLAMKAKQYLST